LHQVGVRQVPCSRTKGSSRKATHSNNQHERRPTMNPTLGAMDDINVEQVARQWIESLKPELKQQLGDSYGILLRQLDLEDATALEDAASNDRTSPPYPSSSPASPSFPEPAAATADFTWLGSDEKGEQLRPAKIRPAWRSTSGGVAPPSTKHLAVQHLRLAHMTSLPTMLPTMEAGRELKPALRRSRATPSSSIRTTTSSASNRCRRSGPMSADSNDPFVINGETVLSRPTLARDFSESGSLGPVQIINRPPPMTTIGP
jgi:hypothetical protein